MVILVNHLTRMQRGYICVAGLDLDTGLHVRPDAHDRLSTAFLRRHGGPFDMACLVDLGPVTYIGAPPEIEDVRFRIDRATCTSVAFPDEFWDHLQRLAVPHLLDTFGPELRPQGGHHFGVAAGRGQASLGCLRLAQAPDLYLHQRPDRSPQVRMRFHDAAGDVDVAVTDIRLYGDDHVTPDVARVEEVADRIAAGIEVILSVGLTRAWAPAPEAPPVHWLQVNNLHLEDDPAWQLQ